MKIERWYAEDHAVTATCHEILQASTALDDPLGPVLSLRQMAATLARKPEPVEGWFVPGGDLGSALAWYWMTMPDLENTDRAYLVMAVDPDFRRQGIGTELLRHASARAALHRRKFLSAALFAGTGTEAFALHAGATPGVLAERRVLHLDKVSDDQISMLSETARRAAPEYYLQYWVGATPDGYLDGMARVYAAFSGDKPSYEAGVERPRWDAHRVRERLDGKAAAYGVLTYSVAAFHRETSEMAALTRVEVDPGTPEWATQQMTVVLGPHRGHRLGLQVKAVLTWWLKQAEPKVQHIVTWSAESNEHMIAINRMLAYELFEPSARFYELPIQTALLPG